MQHVHNVSIKNVMNKENQDVPLLRKSESAMLFFTALRLDFLYNSVENPLVPASEERNSTVDVTSGFLKTRKAETPS